MRERERSFACHIYIYIYIDREQWKRGGKCMREMERDMQRETERQVLRLRLGRSQGG